MNKKNSAIDEEKHPWFFIGGFKEVNESFEKAMTRRVEKETGIKVENVEQISEFYYHATLTDKNVNEMKREENQLLDFFSPKELDNLLLTNGSQELLLKHSSLI